MSGRRSLIVLRMGSLCQLSGGVEEMGMGGRCMSWLSDEYSLALRGVDPLFHYLRLST